MGTAVWRGLYLYLYLYLLFVEWKGLYLYLCLYLLSYETLKRAILWFEVKPGPLVLY